MKSNKKAILGMLVAMVMSLGVMNGINNQKNKFHESNLVWAYMGNYGNPGYTPTTNEKFAYDAMGCVYSSLSGFIAGAAFGGPVGAVVGLGVGL